MNIATCSVRSSLFLAIIPYPKGMCKIKVKQSRSYSDFDKLQLLYMDYNWINNQRNFHTESPPSGNNNSGHNSDNSLQNIQSGVVQSSIQESIYNYYPYTPWYPQYPSFPSPQFNYQYSQYGDPYYPLPYHHQVNPQLSTFNFYSQQHLFRQYFHRHQDVIRPTVQRRTDGRLTMSLRRWEKLIDKPDHSNGFIFTIMSYNVLAQDLVDCHPYLYTHNDPTCLKWEKRWKNLLAEIQQLSPDILCLQEVQESHLKSHYSQLEALGYMGVYKKRTGGRTDGCAIYYKVNNVTLQEHVIVEYYQKFVPLLNRDNVGIVAKFTPKLHPTREFIVATTHLLYNPRRQDVRMAQMQVLFSEIERICFKKDLLDNKSTYLPVLLTGDLNSSPDSDLYEFIVRGTIKYDRMPPGMLNSSSNMLVTSALGITDTCQYASLLKSREANENLSREDEMKLIDLRKSSLDSKRERMLFRTGKLSHPFSVKSVYDHGLEATTFQDRWVTVDYIFYSVRDNRKEDKLKLLARFRLPTGEELGSTKIPNETLGSDHLSLAAKFILEF